MDSSVFLKKEYESLQNESKRKFPNVANACKDALKSLKVNEKDPETMCNKLLAPIENVIETKAQKLYSNALSTLGKL